MLQKGLIISLLLVAGMPSGMLADSEKKQLTEQIKEKTLFLQNTLLNSDLSNDSFDSKKQINVLHRELKKDLCCYDDKLKRSIARHIDPWQENDQKNLRKYKPFILDAIDTLKESSIMVCEEQIKQNGGEVTQQVSVTNDQNGKIYNVIFKVKPLPFYFK